MSDIQIKSTNLSNYVISDVGVRYNASYTRVLRYYIDIRHNVLNLHKEISAPELFILQSKVTALIASWDEKFAQFESRRKLQASQGQAEELTIEAQAKLDKLGSLLRHTLGIDDAIDWEALKDRAKFRRPPPIYTPGFSEPEPTFVAKPQPEYVAPSLSLWDWLFGRKSQRLDEAASEHERDLQAWRSVEEARSLEHRKAVLDWKERRAKSLREQEKKNSDLLAKYEREKAEFIADQEARNKKIEDLHSAWRAGDVEAVLEHALMVLEASDYGGLFEKSATVQYHPGEKLLKVAYDIPSPDALPTLKTVKFVKATGELRETHIGDREKRANFESVAYQICLRTLHELFEADECGNIAKILFNGYVSFIDRSTGREARSCILSVVAEKEAFQSIDLGRVDPRTCFKSLKGVSAASIANLAPIVPVIEMDREDRRFIDARDVGVELDGQTNLASMPWEDFEHLVRELFNKEFALRGGEVKITQSSSDGGVDAVAFDPDPITGGKIVIQAKRYTRTVGVGAVRDLYGTLMNEGASKGILVTTADYGPDAYRFAAGKPLTLMNGANLLHLLERHGYSAKINIVEARQAARVGADA